MQIYLIDIVHNIKNDKIVIKSALNKIYDYTDSSVYDSMIEGIIRNRNKVL